MTDYFFKSCLTILLFLLICRDFWGHIKKLKPASYGKIKIIGICFAIVLLAAATVIFLTMFEFLLLFAVLLTACFFKKRLYVFAMNTLSKNHGKLRLTGVSAAAVFLLWFGLALFYRTDIGMPIGVKNYLYHKYWEEFEVSGFFGATVAGHPTNQLTCYPKNGNPQTDAFNVARKNTLSVGSRRFASDNYYGIWIREDYEKYISTFIDDYFDEFKVYAYFDSGGLNNVKYMSDSLNKNMSLDDFLVYQEKYEESCNYSMVYIYAYNDVLDRELVIKNFNDLTKKMSLDISYSSVILTVVDDEMFFVINRDNIRTLKFECDKIRIGTVLGEYQNDISVID